MSFCTEIEVRNANKKLKKETDVATPDIKDRIEEADDTIIVDLSSLMSKAEITAAGASSEIINLLSRWKSVEITLAQYYGASRSVDQVSDIDYWRKKYDNLIEKILDGDVLITDSSGVVVGPENYPKSKPATTDNAKFYPRKGVEGFTPDGGKIDIKDDDIL